MSTWLLPFVWLVNGMLALVWLLVEHLWQVGLAGVLGYAVLRAPVSQQRLTLVVALFFFVPFVGLLLFASLRPVLQIFLGG